MAEYIEREAAVKAAQDGAAEWDGGYNRNREIYIEAAIDKIPVADVQPVVHGKWIINITEPYGSHCSCCGFAWYYHIDAVKLNPVLSKIETNYCPNCGARMVGNDEVD